MSSKRSHSKSRTGCKQCKTRRIKCDETPITCVNCAKKGIECEYKEFEDAFASSRLLTPGSFAASANRSSRSPQRPSPPEEPDASRATQDNLIAAPTAAPPPPAASNDPPEDLFTIEDVGLMHSYTLSTSLTLPLLDRNEYRQVWQQEIPVLAAAHPFLMHALLGAAAAHRHSENVAASGDPHDHSHQQALHKVRLHYSKALMLFLRVIDEVDEARADAVLSFSIHIVVLTLYLDTQKTADEESPVEYFTHMMNVIHNATRTVETHHHIIEKGRIGPVLAHLRDTEWHVVDPQVACSLVVLNNLLSRYREDSRCAPDEYEGLVDACQKLQWFFTRVVPRPQSWMFILSYPIALRPEFGVLLQRRNPIALCVLAHWCVPLWHAPRRWFVVDWPRRLMHAINDQLQETAWSEGLRWPLSETIHVQDGTQMLVS